MDKSAILTYKTAKIGAALPRYSLDAASKRIVYACNHNRHVNEKHPDRVMKEHDLIYIVDGEWEIFQDETAYTVSAGDVILLLAGRRHYGVRPCSGEVRTIYVHFSACAGDCITDSVQLSRDHYGFPVVRRHSPTSSVPSLLEKLVTAYWQNDVFAPVRAADYLSLVLCELSISTSDIHACASREEMVWRLVQMMQMNPERFYSVSELAEMIHVSRRTLHDYFRSTTGLSPHAFQISAKLEAARQCMNDENLRLKEVAARYGFYDEYHFAKLYKKRFGHHPKGRSVKSSGILDKYFGGR